MVETIREALDQYIKQRMISFHTPGHKSRTEVLSSCAFPEFDLTELPGLDMLHNAQGVIAGAQKKAAGFYGAEQTYYLVNGATAGNQAMFLALMPEIGNKKIRIERRAHRSVSGALVLSGLVPEYIAPVIHPEFNLALGTDICKYLSGLKEVGAFHLTSPSYYGSSVDLEEVINYRNTYAPALPILVDQAHGAHFSGYLFPPGAVALGADMVVHSTHKTLAALTQAAMLHVRGERISKTALQKALELIQTSSPSYLLLASLENAVERIQDQRNWNNLYEEVILLQNKFDGQLRILTGKDAGTFGIKSVDWSKILINVSSLAIGAMEVVNILRKTFRIEPELWDQENILFLLGAGNRPEDVRYLGEALAKIVKDYYLKPKSRLNCPRNIKDEPFRKEVMSNLTVPPMRLTPREAWIASNKTVKVQQSLGKVSAETISIYPPGIPLLIAGEEITREILVVLEKAEAFNWQGWLGFNTGEILVADM